MHNFTRPRLGKFKKNKTKRSKTREVRVIGGFYGGNKLQTPGAGTHPMGERERNALFNMISLWLPGARVMDAFAGSGALGIEALSRGAESVLFIEKDTGAAEAIRMNLDKLMVPDNRFKVLETPIHDAELKNYEFDIVLADPPYDEFDMNEVLKAAETLKHNGILVLSHPDDICKVPGFKFITTRRYAGAHISIYVNF